ncbi:hypothetical protein FHG87_017485 [Trinorchestia longiramus]|nr:hypothetical protein FHG87_017485 [Trinorchestia longiramus]
MCYSRRKTLSTTWSFIPSMTTRRGWISLTLTRLVAVLTSCFGEGFVPVSRGGLGTTFLRLLLFVESDTIGGVGRGFACIMGSAAAAAAVRGGAGVAGEEHNWLLPSYTHDSHHYTHDSHHYTHDSHHYTHDSHHHHQSIFLPTITTMILTTTTNLFSP